MFVLILKTVNIPFSTQKFITIAKKLIANTSKGIKIMIALVEFTYDINGRRIYPFNKGLRIYGGVCATPLLTR